MAPEGAGRLEGRLSHREKSDQDPTSRGFAATDPEGVALAARAVRPPNVPNHCDAASRTAIDQVGYAWTV